MFDSQIYTYSLLSQILVARNKPNEALEISEAGRARAITKLLTNQFTSPDGLEYVNTSDTTLTIDEIRLLAQERNITLVEYALIPEESFKQQGKQRGRTAEIHIWVVQPNGEIHFRQVDLGDEELAVLVTQNREAIGVRNRGGFELAVNEVSTEAQLQTLHQLLIAPIADVLPQDAPDQRVIFIPHEQLFLVPFPALMDGNGDYLIEKHTILTAPSIQVLDLTQKQRLALDHSKNLNADELMLVGNPTMPEVWNPTVSDFQQLTNLPGAEQEVLEIADFFDSQPLLNAAATEQRIKQQIETARVIHFATHGLLEYGKPKDSGMRDFPGAIALAPGNGEDGLLTADEIQQLSLNAELVVLSACDTGLGQITGDGVIGLSRSLITAGAPSVIVSLWSVPDAPTADLMIEFYRQWRSGLDKAQALRQAMLATMETHPEPRDWAAFTLIGESK
ncbi:MAG: CHAT domain-containing protein [Leptolyngbyaceae cyanobacterium MO_188.B28]|nr:CHAT domain-containing protein [Leptolyngbyaceae cyanobacterium MO_188.B28]